MTVNASDTKRDLVKVTISKDHMVASILLRKPPQGEDSVTVDDVLAELEKNDVLFGIDRDAVEKAVTEHDYNTPIKVAQGLKPQRGENSRFDYKFDTALDHRPQEDDDGRIDYHNINFIQNVEKGALLATKMPPTDGSPGKTVTGEEVAGIPGRDLPFKNGVNTEVDDSGLELRATASGAIVFANENISVKDVLTIPSDVDFNVGNIDCRGSVRVKGHVKTGFSIKIDGDLEVDGNVEDAQIEVGGNIFVKGGFFGDEGLMKADGDITVKFAEGQRLESGGCIYVGGEIINCRVDARKEVHVKGKRGKIIGGEIRAGKLIRASVLGSDAGTRTKLFVAYDSELMGKHHHIMMEIKRLNADNQRVKEALYALYRLQMDGNLPPEKQAAMDKLKNFQKELPANVQLLKQQKDEVEKKLAELRDSCIIVDEVLHTGVQAHFGIVYREIVEEVGRCKLVLEGNQVMITDFKESQ